MVSLYLVTCKITDKTDATNIKPTIGINHVFFDRTATDATAKKQNYALVQEFAEKFREQNGAIVCRTLLGLDCPKDEPTPSPRTAEYYKKRPCAELVYEAALIVGKYLENR